MNWHKTIVFLLLLTPLACNSLATEEQPTEYIREGLQGGDKDFSPRFIQLMRADPPALQVAFIEKELSTTFLLESRNGDFETWLSPSGASLTYEQGMLHSTRGFGTGLLASDLSDPLALVLSGRNGVSDRLMTYLDGNDFAVIETFRCQVAIEGTRNLTLQKRLIPTRLMSEDCRNIDQSFRNLYWVSTQSGRIVQSRQWASDVTGEISSRVVFK